MNEISMEERKMLKAVTNVTGGGKRPGKYIDLAAVRLFVNDHKDIEIGEVIKYIFGTPMPDMNFKGLYIHLKKHFNK